MLRIGLTGGIGSGKSTVADLFRELSVPIVDADRISRQLVQPGTEAYAEIVNAFGQDMVGDDGSLDRRRLRERVFARPEEREHLESILHPRVRAAILDELAGLDVPYCIVVVPLLIESGMQDLVDRVLLVDAPEEVRIHRVARRDHTEESQVRRIMDAQIAPDVRRRHADDVLANDGELDSLRSDVADLHRRYLALAVHMFRAQTTKGVNRNWCLIAQTCETFPPQGRGIGMTLGCQYR
jgi:dephospho-CoA kinase